MMLGFDGVMRRVHVARGGDVASHERLPPHPLVGTLPGDVRRTSCAPATQPLPLYRHHALVSVS